MLLLSHNSFLHAEKSYFDALHKRKIPTDHNNLKMKVAVLGNKHEFYFLQNFDSLDSNNTIDIRSNMDITSTSIFA